MIQSSFHSYHAAGGVVLDESGRVLLLERRVPREDGVHHEIRLPKGHIEDGETPEQTALREVCEESGFCQLAVVADLGENTVEFTIRERVTRRHEHYFLMRLLDPQRRPPQPSSPTADEALFQPLWASDLFAAEALLTFDSEKYFVRRARQMAIGYERTLPLITNNQLPISP